MMKKYALIFCSLLVLAWPLSCTSDYPYPGEDQLEDSASDDTIDSESDANDPDAEPGSGDSGDSGTEDPFAGLITYQADVVPILNQLCVACHNASLKEDGVDLSTYELAKREIDDILESMQEEEDEDDLMPPSGRVDNAILQTLVYWKRDGLLKGEAPPEDPGSGTSDGTYTYTEDILTIFEDHCILCHGSNSPAGAFDMSTYQKTIDQIDLIVSTMDRQTGQQGVMPPAGRLDEVTIQKIKDWIDQGMPE
jgi:mono/diheme cytochrome c family protein